MPLLWGPQRRQVVPRPPSFHGGPRLTSTFGYVAGTSQAEPVAAGASRAAELAVPVLVSPRRARHTLAGLSAEVGARLAGHCRGKVERLLGVEEGSSGQAACVLGPQGPALSFQRGHSSCLCSSKGMGRGGRVDPDPSQKNRG